MKTLFLTIFDLRLSKVLVFACRLSSAIIASTIMNAIFTSFSSKVSYRIADIGHQWSVYCLLGDTDLVINPNKILRLWETLQNWEIHAFFGLGSSLYSAVKQAKIKIESLAMTLCSFGLVLYTLVNNYSVMSGRLFLGWTSTKLLKAEDKVSCSVLLVHKDILTLTMPLCDYCHSGTCVLSYFELWQPSCSAEWTIFAIW